MKLENMTTEEVFPTIRYRLLPMAIRRTYGDSCGIARALDVVGERWALLVVRELVLGPKRFTDLRAGLKQLSADVLAQRLRQLEQAGVVRRRTLPPPAGSRVYELTERGHELEPVLLALGRWGSRAAMPAGGGPLGPDALVLALQTQFDPARAAGLAATFELRIGDDRFHARIHDGELRLERGGGDPPDAVIAADSGALAAVLWHDRPLATAEAAGSIAIGGDRAKAARFLELFPLPAPLAA
jgi:DNA-binding HxlR family transcriptional regulator